MKLSEITKDEFRKKLRFPMEFVAEVRQVIIESVERLNSMDWINAEYEEEFADDFVIWVVTLEIDKDNDSSPNRKRTVKGWVEAFESLLFHQRLGDQGVTVEELTSADDHVVIGIKLEA